VPHILYQVINLTKEEIFFGTTDQKLEQEIERLAKDPKSPAAHWKQGDIVQWRPLTDWMEEPIVKNLHKEIESHTPPNKFKVLKTFKG
jgi:hypothetical protein